MLAACSENDREPQAAGRTGTEVVVASFNFPESALLAEIYSGALEAADIPVRREIELGPRELVQPALLQGLVDVVPEYLGTALASLDADSGVDAGDAVAVRARLTQVAARWDLRVLEPAPAENQNGLAVTRETAERLGRHTTSALVEAAGALALGGPPECPVRPYCLLGLERAYGVHFRRFLPFDTEGQRVSALRQQVVDVAVVFTTDGDLATGDLVLLEDDRGLQPVENVVPLVSSAAFDRYGPRLVSALGAVSSRLTSENLTFLNWRVAVAGKDVRAEARGWLQRQGIADPGD